MTVQVIIWWSGLMRGAVSMALAYNQVNSLLAKELFAHSERSGSMKEYSNIIQ